MEDLFFRLEQLLVGTLIALLSALDWDVGSALQTRILPVGTIIVHLGASDSDGGSVLQKLATSRVRW
jgi:hypothetical protein